MEEERKTPEDHVNLGSMFCLRDVKKETFVHCNRRWEQAE